LDYSRPKNQSPRKLQPQSSENFPQNRDLEVYFFQRLSMGANQSTQTPTLRSTENIIRRRRGNEERVSNIKRRRRRRRRRTRR